MVSRFYDGKEPCPGCGRPGTDVPRQSKNGLCRECSEAVSLGRALIRERDLERNNYILDEFQDALLTWYAVPLGKVDTALRRLLSTFSKFDSRHAKGCHGLSNVLTGKLDATTARDLFVLPTETYEAANELCSTLKDVCWELKEERDNMRKQLMVEVRDQKNTIYNEGVQHGRNLLMQLNSGEITPDDFVKPVCKY